VVKRLQPPLAPVVEAMEWHGQVQLEDKVHARLASMSARNSRPCAARSKNWHWAEASAPSGKRHSQHRASGQNLTLGTLLDR